VRTCHRWLPDSALQASGLDAEIGDAVRAWSQKWFAGANWRTQGNLTALASPPADRVLLLDNDLALTIGSGAKEALAGAMLDRAVVREELTDTDRTLIDGLVQACIDDLGTRIGQIFRLATDARWSEASTATSAIDRPRGCAIAGEQRRAPIHLLVAADLVVEHARRGVPPAVSAGGLTPLPEALGEQPIDVAACLGACTLAYGDVAQLAVGDVLILDRALDAPLGLALDGRPLASGRCVVASGDDGFHLEIIEPLSRA